MAEDAIGKVFFTAWEDGLLVEQLISDPFFKFVYWLEQTKYTIASGTIISIKT